MPCLASPCTFLQTASTTWWPTGTCHFYCRSESTGTAQPGSTGSTRRDATRFDSTWLDRSQYRAATRVFRTLDTTCKRNVTATRAGPRKSRFPYPPALPRVKGFSLRKKKSGSIAPRAKVGPVQLVRARSALSRLSSVASLLINRSQLHSRRVSKRKQWNAAAGRADTRASVVSLSREQREVVFGIVKGFSKVSITLLVPRESIYVNVRRVRVYMCISNIEMIGITSWSHRNWILRARLSDKFPTSSAWSYFYGERAYVTQAASNKSRESDQTEFQ